MIIELIQGTVCTTCTDKTGTVSKTNLTVIDGYIFQLPVFL